MINVNHCDELSGSMTKLVSGEQLLLAIALTTERSANPGTWSNPWTGM